MVWKEANRDQVIRVDLLPEQEGISVKISAQTSYGAAPVPASQLINPIIEKLNNKQKFVEIFVKEKSLLFPAALGVFRGHSGMVHS